MIVPTWQTYRAPCIPHATGCRQCGATIADHRAYCSRKCRRRFEIDHFWNTASRHAALKARADYDRERFITDGCSIGSGFIRCVKCGGNMGGIEINHIIPLNGNRPHFGCCHHQSNLEALCHGCHVSETDRQRRVGLIGKPKPQMELLELIENDRC